MYPGVKEIDTTEFNKARIKRVLGERRPDLEALFDRKEIYLSFSIREPKTRTVLLDHTTWSVGQEFGDRKTDEALWEYLRKLSNYNF